MTIRLTIRLFGTLSLKVPDYNHKKGIVVDAADGATPVDILKQLRLPLSQIGLISHDCQAISSDTCLADGMVISFFSPVYGG